MMSRPATNTRKKVQIRRIADARNARLLEPSDVDDLLDTFGIQDAELVVMHVAVDDDDDRSPPPRSGVRPAPIPESIPEDDIEELVDGVTEGWD
jgi:hypothetical protein